VIVGAGTQIGGEMSNIVVDAARIAVVIGVLGFTGLPATAADAPAATKQNLQQTVDVREIHAERDQVSGVLVNLSSKPVHDVRVRIDNAWLWADERHAGGTEESPGRTAVYTVPGEIPPGGRLSFTYRAETPLPQRTDGRFETSVSVVAFGQAG
jgi:hypothetical protein